MNKIAYTNNNRWKELMQLKYSKTLLQCQTNYQQ